MRFHVLGMAHTQTTKDFSSCAYTQKIRLFCKMMMAKGHEVYLYAGENNDAPCTQHYVCITEAEQEKYLKGQHYLKAEHNANAKHWVVFNGRACGHLAANAEKGDFLCVIFGFAQKTVADAFPILKTVEYGVGYHHTFAPHRVFESYAWMHMVYAAQAHSSDIDGIFFDGVINGYLDPSQFPLGDHKKDYLLYLGRIIDRKGVKMCAEIAKASGKHLIVAGTGGDPPPGCEFRNEVGPKERAELLGNARAVLMPTLYVEPFGNVAIEAMASGTPVITTDWGAFTETVIDNVTGFRCRSLQEFVDAVKMSELCDHKAIRDYAVRRFGIETKADEYDRYFKRLSTLWGKGFYEMRDDNGGPSGVDNPTPPGSDGGGIHSRADDSSQSRVELTG